MEADVIKCKRIQICGAVGSGKSTLAKQLGEILNLPVFHLDCFWSLPNGKVENDDILHKKIHDITQDKKWIIDGNYRTTNLTERFNVADVVIWLNYPFEFCIESAKLRVMQSGNGNAAGKMYHELLQFQRRVSI